MLSSSSGGSWGFRIVLVFLAIGVHALPAEAQRQAQGFMLDRFSPSPPGAGWLVMDALELHGGLGGAIALNTGYANTPLRVTDGSRQLAVVSDYAVADLGFAITYRRWRFYLNLDLPLAIAGATGTVGGYSFTSPSVNLASKPDTLSDPRIGTDVRIADAANGHFRLGASAQLFVPNGNRTDYNTDGMFRGMVRVLFAGDAGIFTWAGHLGVHIRLLDDSPAPGSAQGSEMLFGVAGGARLTINRSATWAVVVGPEVYGATAFRGFFGGNTTVLEGLLGARLEGTRHDKLQLRLKLGGGAGLNQQFGAPVWRLVFSIEIFNHNLRTASPATIL